jgi:multidrug efflux pump
LFEAIAIVLAVSFLSLGWRTGLVVALSIPLVIATTFLLMKVFGIDFQRISLGALVIALGLLVDDAIIAVEMMLVKMEQGWDRFKAASFAYTSTAFPMLTGTLITAAGFVPVGFAKSSAGEYTFSIFAVLTISLLVSWVVAVVFTPYIGALILPDYRPKAGEAHGHGEDVYQRRFYRIFRAVVDWCVERRWTVIAATLGVFVFSVWAFQFVQQQFFPSSNRPELIVDLRLPEGSSIRATAAEAKKLEALIEGDPDIVHFVTYVGGGTPRFYLPLDIQLQQVGLSQIVIQTRDDDARERVRTKIQRAFDEGFDMVRGRVNRLENGPPVGFPVQFRVSGENPTEVRRIATDVMRVMRENQWTAGVHLDWNELAKVVELDIDQDKARVVGLSTQDLSLVMNSIMSGVTVTQYRERNDLIDVVFRAVPEERLSLEGLRDINVPHPSGRPMPVSQLAKINFGFEEGVIWRRDRLPTINVRADIAGDIQAPVVSKQIEPRLDELRAKLPPGYSITMGGAIEESAKGQSSINAVVPVMILIMLTLLMIQLQNFQRMILTFLTAPLGIIGVTWALLASNRPFGFVAMLGAIALGGMIIRNSVILVDQIEQDIKAGSDPWTAIVESAVRRFRPIMLTALAAILGMIPLARSNFFGPMATAIMGGLLVATVLTLLSFPAMYAAWFRVKRPG